MVVILALGSMVKPSLDAADRLAADGISAAVVNARFVKPLDEELILPLARKTGRVVTVEEHALQGGFGGAVLECLQARETGDINVRRIGLPDRFIEHGEPAVLRRKYGLDSESIFNVVQAFVKKAGHKIPLAVEGQGRALR